MRLLFIHGRAQEEFEEAELKTTWTHALQLSFADSGLKNIPEEIKIDFVYYATDLINLLNQYKNGPKNGKLVFRGQNDINTKLENFQAAFVEDMANNAQIDKAAATREYGSETEERGPLNNRVSVAMMRALDNKLPQVANFSIKKKTEDVGLYLVVDEVNSHINDMVIEKLTKEPTIIIAHSLGTIIAYNVLKAIEKKDYDIKMLITLGSPLGVKSVKRQLKGRLSFPSSLKGDWHNLYDPLDYVSLHPLDSKNFNTDPPIRNYQVENQSDNRHGILHYLSNPKIANIINDYLKSL